MWNFKNGRKHNNNAVKRGHYKHKFRPRYFKRRKYKLINDKTDVQPY